MHSIQSRDGTPIRYFRRGHGPAILLIHGTAADHSRWAPVVPALQRHFTVYAMDRRGRGGSGDAALYRMDDEFADVAAVAAAIDGGPGSRVGIGKGLSSTSMRRSRKFRRGRSRRCGRCRTGPSR
jgi:pimeloyl-ACP methyl ester carboxylesterase